MFFLITTYHLLQNQVEKIYVSIPKEIAEIFRIKSELFHHFTFAEQELDLSIIYLGTYKIYESDLNQVKKFLINKSDIVPAMIG